MGVVAVLASSEALAVDAVPGTVATLRWSPASGPVAGYGWFVARNGGPLVQEGLTTTNQAKLSGKPGEFIEVVVRAWGYPNGEQTAFEWGPESKRSEPIRFDGAPVVTSAYPILDCASCGRFEMRDLTNTPLLVAQHPSPGSWKLAGVGALGSDLQVVFREESTGALWVGDLWADRMLPLASHVEPGFAASTVPPPVDLDRDGVAEILVYDAVAGRVEVWGIVNGALVRRAIWLVQAGSRFVGAGDRDGDGIPELWFDAQGGFVRVYRYRDANALVFSTPAIGYTPVDVADYDGDGLADVLWRNQTGALLVTLIWGDWDMPEVESLPLVSQPGDANVEPRVSFDLDGVRGAEILLQDRVSGSVDVALPSDPIPGRRQRLLPGDPGWRVVGLD